MSRIQEAMTRLSGECSCSQAILVTYGTKMGLDRELAYKIASTFGGGMGRTGATCGAVTGALMVLGLRHDMADPDAKEISYIRAQEFLEKFKTRNGSTICHELLGRDIHTLEDVAYARRDQLFQTICPKLVQSAAEILEEMDDEEDS